VIGHPDDVEDRLVRLERDEVDLGVREPIAKRREAATRHDDRPHPEELHHHDLLDRASPGERLSDPVRRGEHAARGIAQQPVEAAEVLMRRSVEVGAIVAREGLEFGVLARTLAVGGQVVTLRGLAGEYDEVFLPLMGQHQAHNAAVALAAVEAFLGGGHAERGPLDVDIVRAAFAKVTSPGRLEVARRSPTVLLDAAHNPAGARATAEAVQDSFGFTRLVGVFAAMADKDVRGMLEALEPVLAEVVVTESTSGRAMPADDLAAIAVEVFGDDRVEVTPRLDDAIDSAVSLAEEEGDLGGSGVLVTGSIVTVAEARTLLGLGDR
jgi:dihydrofolate synthase/folylpolyglutamate synthase